MTTQIPDWLARSRASLHDDLVTTLEHLRSTLAKARHRSPPNVGDLTVLRRSVQRFVDDFTRFDPVLTAELCRRADFVAERTLEGSKYDLAKNEAQIQLAKPDFTRACEPDTRSAKLIAARNLQHADLAENGRCSHYLTESLYAEAAKLKQLLGIGEVERIEEDGTDHIHLSKYALPKTELWIDILDTCNTWLKENQSIIRAAENLRADGCFWLWYTARSYEQDPPDKSLIVSEVIPDKPEMVYADSVRDIIASMRDAVDIVDGEFIQYGREHTPPADAGLEILTNLLTHLSPRRSKILHFLWNHRITEIDDIAKGVYGEASVQSKSVIEEVDRVIQEIHSQEEGLKIHVSRSPRFVKLEIR